MWPPLPASGTLTLHHHFTPSVRPMQESGPESSPLLSLAAMLWPLCMGHCNLSPWSLDPLWTVHLNAVIWHTAFYVCFPPGTFSGLAGAAACVSCVPKANIPVCVHTAFCVLCVHPWTGSCSHLGGFAGLAAVHGCVVSVWLCAISCAHTQA